MTADSNKEKLKDKRKLNKILKLIPAERKPIGEKLIAEIVFMSSTLTDLKKIISEKGTVENFKQGKQEFTRESPALKAYNTTIQRYSLFYRQLTDLLPKTEQADKTKSELLEFFKESRDKV